MKKLILAMVFVFATGTTFMNANTNVVNNPFDCTADAMDFGTGMGNGDPFLEWYWTDQYFEYYCNEDGTYRIPPPK